MALRTIHIGAVEDAFQWDDAVTPFYSDGSTPMGLIIPLAPTVDNAAVRKVDLTDGAVNPLADLSYVLISANAAIPNERVLSVSGGLTLVDGGAGASVTIGLPSPFTSGNVLSANGSAFVSLTPDVAGLVDKSSTQTGIAGNKTFIGATTFQTSVDSTTGFQVIDADGGTATFTVDTVNERVGIGITPTATLHLGRTGSDALFIAYNNTVNAVTIAGNGRVTIGSTSPDLTISGGQTVTFSSSGTISNFGTITSPSSGTGALTINSGNVRIGGDAGAKLNIFNTTVGTICTTIRAASGQTANLLRIEDNSGTALFAIDKDGTILKTGITAGNISEVISIYADITGAGAAGSGVSAGFYCDNSSNVKLLIGSFTFIETSLSGANIAADFHIDLYNNTSAGAEEKFRLKSNSSIVVSLTSSTTVRELYSIVPSWGVSTDANRTGRVVFNVYDTTAREVLRIEASGSAGMFGAFGVAAVVRPTAYTQTYSTATKTHAARTAVTLTDNSAGTANTTVEALPDPADTPLTADALRDDIVTNLLPALRNNFADIVAQINALKTDIDNTAQFANQMCDDHQALGWLQ